MGVALGLYAGEDWWQVLNFYGDPVSDPQTFNDPLPLSAPTMKIKSQRNTEVLAQLDTTGTADGLLVVGSGSDQGKLTIKLPSAITEKLLSEGSVRFDIFDTIGGQRIAILKSGTITIDGV